MIKRLIVKLKALSSSSDKHDCMESREMVEKIQLIEGNCYMSHPKYYMGDTYNVKCKICGLSWWQNYPI